MRRFTSLLLVLTMLFSMAPGLGFAADPPSAAAGTLVATAAEFKTALADSAVATITLTADIDSTEQLTVSRPVTINGAGLTLKVTADLGKVNGSKHALMLLGGVAGSPIVVNGLTVDSNAFAYGVSTYNAAVVELNKVTIKGSKGAGLTVNGSNVTATDFATSGNAWGAVNVDPGSGVLTPSVFTLKSGTLGEANKIWSDNANVTATATVLVDAAGFKPVPTGTSVSVWAPTRADIQVTTADELVAAIRDLRPLDTIVLAAGTYDVKRDLGDLTFGAQGGSAQTGWYLPISQPGVTIKGAGSDKTILTSSVESANGAWASQDFITVWANGVTIDGVKLLSKAETNKAIEVFGKNFTLKNTRVITNPAGPDLAGSPFYEFSGSVYFNPLVAITGIAGDVGESRLENVFVESAWISAKPTVVTAGTIVLKGVTVDWVDAFYASYVFPGGGSSGLMSSNPTVFKVESDVRFVVDNTIADLNAQAISRMPAGAVLEFKSATVGTPAWTFPAGAFEGSKITTFSAGVNVNALAYGVNAYNLDFAQSGDLPATAKVAISLGASAANKAFDSYKFVAGKLSAVVERVTADANGVVTLSVNRGDAWFLYEYRVQTVVFNSNGGSAVADQKVVYDARAAAPATPTKVGYTFAGWFTNAELTHPANFASDKVVANTTMYAKYTINTNLVTFKGWNGSTIVVQTVNYGSAAVAPAVTAPVGYVFTGWDKPITNIMAPVTTTAIFAKSAVVRTSPNLGNVVAPRTMSRFKSSIVTGYLKPAHTPGSRPVRIYRWKRTASGAWKSYGYVSAKAYKNWSYTRYTTSIRLGYAGTWKLRSYAPADAAHTAKWSAGYDYVTVK